MDVHLRRLLKEIVLACGQARVAMRMGSDGPKIRKAYEGEHARLATICRMAEACDCELILRARQEPQ